MDLNKYIDDAAVIYKNTYAELDKLRIEKQNEERELKRNSHRLTKEANDEDQAALKKKYADLQTNIITAHTEELAKIKAGYFKEVDSFYQPDGSAIDQNDRLLLESGILKANEVAGLIEKHKDNTTMLRIISQKASEEILNEMPVNVQRTLLLAEKAGEGEKRVFNSFNQLMGNPIRMAAQGIHETAPESFLYSVERAEKNIEGAKKDLLNAQLYISEEMQAVVE